MIKKVSLVNFKDIKFYLISTLSLCLIAYLVNAKFDTFFMYINKAPFDNPILVLLESIVGVFYPIVVALFQTLGSFIVSYVLYKIIQKRM